jgi:hypothetical protein
VPIYDDLDYKRKPVDLLERCRRDFEATANPLYAWEGWIAWSVSRRSGWLRFREPLPKWIAQYFDECARHLIGRLNPGEWSAIPGEGPGSIGRALGFSEGLAKAREQWGVPFDRREVLALKMVELMWSEGCSLDAAALEAEHLRWASHRTARRAVERAQRNALRRMQDYLREAGWDVSTDKREVIRTYSRLCKNRAR